MILSTSYLKSRCAHSVMRCWVGVSTALAVLASALVDCNGVAAAQPPSQLIATAEETIPADTCLVRLEVPDSARIRINGRDYGSRREFEFKPLTPGKRYLLKLAVRFADRREAQRVLFIEGGQVVRRAILQPSRIAFVQFPSGEPGEGDENLYIMNPDGTGVRRITQGDGYGSPAISPDGSKIAFEHDDDSICIIKYDGTNFRRLTEGAGPRWSPDGSKIVFTRYSSAEKTRHVYLMSDDGSNVRRLVEGRLPCWSPDGSKVLFGRSARSGESEICVIGSDGNGLKRLTTGSTAHWSPRGWKIAFRRSLGSKSEIHVMNVDGSGVRRLTSGDFPIWSPDGSKIAFFRFTRDYALEVWVMNADGTQRRKVTPSGNYVGEVFAWSPDGSKLALELIAVSQESATASIYVVNANGSGGQKLGGRGFSHFPNWQ